jgi:hypothetical protein
MAASRWVRSSTRLRSEPSAKELARRQLIRRAIAIGRAKRARKNKVMAANRPDLWALPISRQSVPIGFGRRPTLLFRQRGKLIHTDFPHRVIDLVTLEMRADHQSRPIEVRE